MDSPFVNIHTHARTGEGIEVVSVMAGMQGVLPAPPFSVGIHPWQLEKLDGIGLELAFREVETLPANAIGEVGLDYASKGDPSEQKMILAAQLRIAEARRLPVVLHCVRALEPIMEILPAYRLPAIVFHGFTGSRVEAARAVRSGCYLSFGPRSFSSPKTLEALHRTPPERIFFETDDAPAQPISEIYTRAAKILDIPVPELTGRLYDNYLTIFAQ